jgi:phosphate:Na+ symporter
MSPLNALVFGLGLFFLGMRLVGDNLKGLCSGGFRVGIARTTQRPVLRGMLGLSAGALMQSATAVTFICVGMVTAGLLSATAAGVVIIWSNVGLTALAFVAALNIHPYVAFVVGGSGIVLGIVRIRAWQTVAGVLLGMGLILLGLEQMGAGAAPLKNEESFRHAMALAVGSPPLTFLAGILIAAILQSNTGATMMIITLAGAGAISLENAALLIYGTNLGAIALRLVLASGLKGKAARLVRLEDLFCVISGALMFLLYYLEAAGLPLVFALARELAGGIPPQLAVIFLLSNLIPAVLMMPALPWCQKLLVALWPGEASGDTGVPKFLQMTALDDPPTALDLLRKELANLTGGITGEEANAEDSGEESSPPPDFQSLSLAIEDFAAKLASRSALRKSEAKRLHKLRAILSGIRHVEEAVRSVAGRARRNPDAVSPELRLSLSSTLAQLVAAAAVAMNDPDPGPANAFREQTKRHGPFLDELRHRAFPPAESRSVPIARAALSEDFEIAVWTLHRLAKLICSTDA